MRPPSILQLVALVVARTQHGRLAAAAFGVLLLAGATAVALTTETRHFCNHRREPAVPQRPIERAYLFHDDGDGDLEDLRRELETLGYHSAVIDSGPCNPCDTMELKVLKTDELNLASVRAREDELCELAKQHDVEDFWAMFPTDAAYEPKR